MTSEEMLDLVRRAQDGDREAFGRIYDEFVDRVFGYILSKIRSRPEAEDLTEQVFVNALDGLAGFDPQSGSFGGWLYRIAHNQVVDVFRRRSRVQEIEFEEAVLTSTAPSVEELYARLETAQEIRAALDGLTAEQRQVVVLRFFGNLPNEAVARALGKSEGSIKALQHRALRSLARIFREGPKR